VDVAAVATHEGGHMLGLDHVCGSAPYDACPSPGAIMSPQVGSAAQRAALTADDVNGICTIYPKNAATLTCAPPEQHKGGGCSSAGGGGLAGLLAAAAIAALRQRRRTGA
jgi:MYXO-CTERM domain-containing protein